MAVPEAGAGGLATGGPARRGLVRASLVGLALLALAGCGIVPISGPPEGDFGSRSSRQR